MKSSMSWSLPFLCAALAWGCQTNSAPQRKRVAVPKSTTAQQTEDIGKSSSSESIAEGLKSAVSRYSDQTGKEIKTPDVATLIKAIDKAAPQAAANAMVDQAGVTKAPGDKTLTGGTMWSYLLAEISQPGLLIPIGLGVAGLGASAFVPALRAYLKNVYVADQASKPAEGNGLRAEETRVAGASGGGEAPIGQVQPGAASAAAPVVARAVLYKSSQRLKYLCQVIMVHCCLDSLHWSGTALSLV
ncbi:MAG: hypothetical protein KA436_09615 [Oligoflexales bacterium]|nr:hypothetical protein [Oligoflexales bacterium]